MILCKNLARTFGNFPGFQYIDRYPDANLLSVRYCMFSGEQKLRKLFFSIIALIASSVAAYACPDPSQWGVSQGAFSGGDLYQPRYFDVVAGGDWSLTTECGYIYNSLRSDRGDGWFTSQPDFTIETPGMQGYTLHVAVVSNCDASLLINTPAGNWYYDDDDNGNLDPIITLSNPSSGLLDIWVGTFNGEFCDAQLRLETF